MDADGDNVTPLTHHKKGEGFAASTNWSPDGKEIAFEQVKDDHGREIYTMKMANGAQRRLTDSDLGFVNFDPKWSPDGKQILHYVAINARVDDTHLMITDKDGRHYERVPLPEWHLNHGSVYENATQFGTVTINADEAPHGLGGRGVSVVPGFYYLDTYTSIDILYAKRRAGHPLRIKYAEIPKVTSVTEIE